MSLARFRVMKDCFYILLRYYLRVDGVEVRIMDTRIYHDFETNFIHRDFQLRENTYAELTEKGFKTEAPWSIDPNQHDMIFGTLDTKARTIDKVYF